QSSGESDSLLSSTNARNPVRGSKKRYVNTSAEIYAIPISVAIGFFIPSIAVLFALNATTIVIWLLFPLWVSLVRQAARGLLISLPLFPQFTGDENDTKYLESDRLSLS